MQIGVFDSGVGGISVLHDMLKRMPHEDFLYYADTSNVPYGPKPKDEVRKHVSNAMEFIVGQGVKAIVVACITATSVAIRDVREKYSIPIIGMEPSVKPAVEKNANKRILVTATELTLKEEKLQNLIAKLDNAHIVDALPLPGLVDFAEKLEFSEQMVLPYLQKQLVEFDLHDYETVVLGCTHFSFFKDMFRKILPPNVDIIDGNMGTVKNLIRILTDIGSLNEGSGNIVFYHSGCKVEDKAQLETYSILLKRLDAINM